MKGCIGTHQWDIMMALMIMTIIGTRPDAAARLIAVHISEPSPTHSATALGSDLTQAPSGRKSAATARCGRRRLAVQPKYGM
eukprot:6180761-Pleurochrysis_carterae.AAC.1